VTVQLVIAEPSLKTGKILAELMQERGMKVLRNTPAPALISYGVRIGATSKPCLNANAGMADKLSQLLLVQKGGVLIPSIYEAGHNVHFPLLARKRHHRAGRDIMPVFQASEIPWRKAAGADFFIEYIPIEEEYRVWVFRNRHKGTYQKKMVRPAEYKKIGRNFKNGFAFELVQSENVPRGAVDLAVASLKALSLDFGAVDILKGLDGRYYFLEVNTAPGVEGEKRQVIRGFADEFAAWEKAGYPRR
jgi:hypothetical protein